MVVCFACMAVFLAVFDPLTSFNHGLRTVTSAQDPVLLCVFECVFVISLIREVTWTHWRLMAGSHHRPTFCYHLWWNRDKKSYFWNRNLNRNFHSFMRHSTSQNSKIMPPGCLPSSWQTSNLPECTIVWLEAKFLHSTWVSLPKNYCTYGLIWDQDVSQPLKLDGDDKENVWHYKVHLS